MTFGFLVAGFIAGANAGRVALAAQASRPTPASRALALVLGAALIVAGATLADDLLEGLEISPESFRIAAGIVLAAAALWALLGPQPLAGPFAAILITPELACLAISFGADEPLGKVLGDANTPIAGFIKSGALDLSKPANLVNIMPKKPAALVDAKDDLVTLDLMKVPKIAENPRLRRTLPVLLPAVGLAAIQTKDDHLDLYLKFRASGIPDAFAAARAAV